MAIVSATLQAAVLSVASNVLAQLMTASRKKEMSIDWIPVLQFLVFSIVNTPPNYLWQEYLESAFPSRPRRGGKRALSKTNTLAKFLLDQTVGAAVNTLLFSLFVHGLQDAMKPAPRLNHLPDALAYCLRPGAVDVRRVDGPALLALAAAEFWPIINAGVRFWPLISLLNFTIVRTVATRNLVGALAGVAWGMYMSIMAARS